MSAAQQLEGAHVSIALVDLSYLFKKEWHSPAAKESPEAAANNTLARLAGVRETTDHVIICCDSPPYRRKEIDANYKATREKPTEGEVAWKRWLLDRIEKDGYQIAKAKGYEADDVIATLCLAYSWCQDVRIIGCDKDVAQCVTDNVRMYVPSVGNRPAEIRGPAEILAKYGVQPKDMGLWLALVGDKGDNIPGVPGIGEKKAAQLIGQCISLQGIAEALAEDDGSKPSAMWVALGANWEQLVASTKLTALDMAAPVDAESLLAKREPEKLVDDEEDMTNGMQTEQTNGVADAEFDPISKAPEGYVAPPVPERQKSEPPPAPATTTAIVKTSVVTEDLQPLDLNSAYRLATAFHNGRMYSKFPNEMAIFTILVKARELGLKVTTALDGFHVIEGKPSASADMMRALAMRHPDCEYFRLIESTPEKATWETKNKRNPEPTRYTYTIEEARQAGMRGGNWGKRDRQMLSKTCSSILARLEYPGATVGLYCPEELDAA